MLHFVPSPLQAKVLAGEVCYYCRRSTQTVDAVSIYGAGADLSWGRQFKWCRYCDAYVGCHPDGSAYGRVADRALRKKRNQAHTIFDPLWRTGIMSRADAYAWLANALGLPIAYTHIAMFGEQTCDRVIEVSLNYRRTPPIKLGVSKYVLV